MTVLVRAVVSLPVKCRSCGKIPEVLDRQIVRTGACPTTTAVPRETWSHHLCIPQKSFHSIV